MPNTTLSDYIMVFEDAISQTYCQQLIEQFELSGALEICERPSGHRFTQLNITKNWPEQHELMLPIFMSYFTQFRTTTEAYYWPPAFSFEHIRLKRYLPNGRDHFPPHVDVVNHLSARRFVTAMIYLNEPEGGETVFPNLGVSIAPKPGKLAIFPPVWMFPHAGLPPRASPKYILHTYLCYGDTPS